MLLEVHQQQFRGAGGVERIVEVEFNAEEKAMFDKSVAAVKSLIDATNKIVGR